MKKGNKKRAIAMLAAAAMLATSTVTTYAEENTASNLEPVELNWLLRIPEQPDGQEVVDELNKILKEKINATVNIQFIDPVAYPEKTKLKITSGEEFDLMFTSAGYGFYDYASKGGFLPLDELLEEYAPQTYAQIPESFWDATRVNGDIYGIPNYQIVARQPSLTFRKELVEKYGLDVENIKTIEDMEPVLQTLKENETDKQFIFAPPVLNHFDTMTYLGLEGIGADGTPGCIEIDGTDLTVINQYESEPFVNLIKTLKSYEEAGYVNKDLSLIEDQTEQHKNGEILCSAFDTYKPGVETEMEARYGYERVYQTTTDPYTNTSSILGTLQAVSATSKNPERAMMFLELVNTDPEIYNLIVYGILDKHYTMNEDGTIEKVADAGYNTNVPWMIGNTFNGYRLSGTAEDINERTQEMNETSRTSRIMGFSFNPEPVKAEISQCQTVCDKYLKGFQYAMYDDLEGTLATFNEELRAAGMDAVIAEKQAQLDEWAAAK